MTRCLQPSRIWIHGIAAAGFATGFLFPLECPAGDPIEFSRPGKTSAKTENLLREYKFDNTARLFDKSIDPSASVTIPHRALSVPEQSSSLSSDRELRKLLDQRRNWIFVNPAEFGIGESKSTSDKEMINDSPQNLFGEAEEMSIIERFLTEKDGAPHQNATDEENSDDSMFSYAGSGGQFGTDLFGSSGNTATNDFGALPAGETSFLDDSLTGIDDLSTTSAQPGGAWEAVFGENNGGNTLQLDDYFDSTELETWMKEGESFESRIFTSTSFLHSREESGGFVGRRSESFEALLAPPERKRRLGQADLLNLSSDPTRQALNPVTPASANNGFNSPDSIQFSGFQDASAGSSRRSNAGFLNSSLFDSTASIQSSPRANNLPNTQRPQIQTQKRQPTVFRFPDPGF